MLEGFKSGGRTLEYLQPFYTFTLNVAPQAPNTVPILCLREAHLDATATVNPERIACVTAVFSDTDQSRRVFQVRNLCYMVTRRERMKHTLCDLQEKIFHLQIQLLEEDIAGGETQPFHFAFIYFFCFLHNLLQCRGRCTRGRQHSLLRRKKGVERKEKERNQPGELVKLKRLAAPRRAWLKCSGWTVLKEACQCFCMLGHT